MKNSFFSEPVNKISWLDSKFETFVDEFFRLSTMQHIGYRHLDDAKTCDLHGVCAKKTFSDFFGHGIVNTVHGQTFESQTVKIQ